MGVSQNGSLLANLGHVEGKLQFGGPHWKENPGSTLILVSPLTPIMLPSIIPYIALFKEFRP